MRISKFIHAATWLGVLASAFATTTFLFFFFSFVLYPVSVQNQERSWVDAAFPYLFLIGGVFFLRQTWRTFKEARAYQESSEYKDKWEVSKTRGKTDVPKTYTPDSNANAYIRAKVAILIKHNVISQVEYEKSNIEAALRADEWEADYFSLSSLLLSIYDSNPDLFSNLYCRVEQVEVSEQDYVHLIDKLARMLQLQEHPNNIRLVSGKKNSTLSFHWSEQTHHFKGGFPSKFLAWDVIPDVARLLETRAHGRLICCSATDMQFVLTALTDDERIALNNDFHDETMEDMEIFQQLT